MSDHDTWNMFAAASYAAWLAGGDYAAEECRTRAVADADWFVIESKKRAEAEAAEYKAELRRVINGEPAEPTPPQPDDDGWIKHDGMSVPVDPRTIVDAKDADGFVWEDVIVGEDECVKDMFWLWNTPRGEDVAPHLRIAKYRVSGSGRIVSDAGVTK